jgi:hypothetical protein
MSAAALAPECAPRLQRALARAEASAQLFRNAAARGAEIRPLQLEDHRAAVLGELLDALDAPDSPDDAPGAAALGARFLAAMYPLTAAERETT